MSRIEPIFVVTDEDGFITDHEEAMRLFEWESRLGLIIEEIKHRSTTKPVIPAPDNRLTLPPSPRDRIAVRIATKTALRG